MKPTTRQEKALLLKTANTVLRELWPRIEGTSLRLRMPQVVHESSTCGWYARLGRMGKKKLAVDLWLDLFTNSKQRKFSVSINSSNKTAMVDMVNRVSREYRPFRVIRDKDLNSSDFLALAKNLERQAYGKPIFEKYRNDYSYFYGFYDLTAQTTGTAVNVNFCRRAAAFIESVARTLPYSKPEDPDRETFPKIENRKKVVSHLLRERSRYLATERKEMDKYICQVCGMSFEKKYGKLGRGFAEAHHLVPLNRLRGKVSTGIEDLRSVCANCHRMLHRMDGKHGDFIKLRRIVVGKHRIVRSEKRFKAI